MCIRSCPLYYPGAIGFTTVNGQPRVGELKEQAWTISEKCRFKVLPLSVLERKNADLVQEQRKSIVDNAAGDNTVEPSSSQQKLESSSLQSKNRSKDHFL